jgi:diguanylate cyclase (GGDEF)-like protein
MPDMEIISAFERVELICRIFSSSHVSFADFCIEVSASFGIAVFPKHGNTVNGLMAAADKALYAAKAAGRNCVKLCVGD